MNKTSNFLGSIREVRDEELLLILNWRNDLNVRKNMYTTHIISEEEHLKWWNEVKKCSTKKYLIYLINDKPSGVIGYTNIDLKNSSCSWIFYKSPDAITGTGVRMEFLAVDHAFFEMNLHKIYCEVLEFNKSVIRLHQNFGFKIEGRFREQYLNKNQYVDILRMGLLKSEWLECKNNLRDILDWLKA